MQTQNEAAEKQLRDLEHQNGGMATFAHWCAGLLLFAFSLGSLISISNAAFIKFLAAANAGKLDIPDGISLLVNILLILACDVGMLYAASVLRVLNANGAPKDHKTIHLWAMWAAAGLESITYLYLAWIFDRPDTWFLWGIMIARAIASPLFAAYLSMARALPVGPGDVAYHASLASGRGVIRDVATLAADPDASLERKVRIYRASAQMTAQDRTRFDGIVEAVSEQDPRAVVVAAPDRPPTPPNGGLRLLAPKAPARRGSAVRTPRASDAPASYEKMATAAFAAGATSIEKMRAATGMSKTAAAGWVRTLKAEAKGSAVRTRKARNRDTVTGAAAAV